MLSIGRREPRWIAGAVCFALGVAAWAEGAPDGSSGSVLVAAIAPPPPTEVLSPMPEPSQYVYRYEMQYSSYQGMASALKPSDFYAVPFGVSSPLDVRAAQPAGTRPQAQATFRQQAQPQETGNAFNTVAPSASLIDMFQLSDDPATSTPAHPQRRLALLIDDWRVSASAHIPLMHAHDTGATISVRRGF